MNNSSGLRSCLHFSVWGGLAAASLGIGAIGLAGMLFAKLVPKNSFVLQHRAWILPTSYSCIGLAGTGEILVISRLFISCCTRGKKQPQVLLQPEMPADKAPNDEEDQPEVADDHKEQIPEGQPLNQEIAGGGVDENQEIPAPEENQLIEPEVVEEEEIEKQEEPEEIQEESYEIERKMNGEVVVRGLLRGPEQLVDLLDPVIEGMGLSEEQQQVAKAAKGQIKETLKRYRHFSLARQYVQSVLSDFIPFFSCIEIGNGISLNISTLLGFFSSGLNQIRGHLQGYQDGESFNALARQVRQDATFPLGQRPIAWLLRLLGAVQNRASCARSPKKTKNNEKSSAPIPQIIPQSGLIVKVVEKQSNIVINVEGSNEDDGIFYEYDGKVIEDFEEWQADQLEKGNSIAIVGEDGGQIRMIRRNDRRHSPQLAESEVKPSLNPLYRKIDEAVDPLLACAEGKIPELDGTVLSALDVLSGRKVHEGGAVGKVKGMVVKGALSIAQKIVGDAAGVVIGIVKKVLSYGVRKSIESHQKTSPIRQFNEGMDRYVQARLVQWFLKSRYEAEKSQVQLSDGQQPETFDQFLIRKSGLKRGAERANSYRKTLEKYGVAEKQLTQALEQAKKQAEEAYTKDAESAVERSMGAMLAQRFAGDPIALQAHREQAVEEYKDANRQFFYVALVKKLFEKFHVEIKTQKGSFSKKDLSVEVAAVDIKSHPLVEETCKRIVREAEAVKLDICSGMTRQKRKTVNQEQKEKERQIKELQNAQATLAGQMVPLQAPLQKHFEEQGVTDAAILQLKEKREKLAIQLQTLQHDIGEMAHKATLKKGSQCPVIHKNVNAIEENIGEQKKRLQDRQEALEKVTASLKQQRQEFLEAVQDQGLLQANVMMGVSVDTMVKAFEKVNERLAIAKQALIDTTNKIQAIGKEIKELEQSIPEQERALLLQRQKLRKTQREEVLQGLSGKLQAQYQNLIGQEEDVLAQLERNHRSIETLTKEKAQQNEAFASQHKALSALKQQAKQLQKQISTLEEEVLAMQQRQEAVAKKGEAFGELCSTWRRTEGFWQLLSDLIDPVVTLMITLVSGVVQQKDKKVEYQSALQQVVEGAFEAEAHPKQALEGVLNLAVLLLRDLQEPLSLAQGKVGVLIQSFAGKDSSMSQIMD